MIMRNEMSWWRALMLSVILAAVAFAVPSVELLSPQSGLGLNTLVPTFEWSTTGSGTVSSTLYLSSDADPFTNGTKYEAGSAESFNMTPDLIPGQNYHWGVQVTDAGGAVRSAVQSFWILEDAFYVFNTTHKIDDVGAESVYACDFDGDGDDDILAASGVWGVKLYENNGNGVFTDVAIVTDAVKVESLYASDVDGDGDMDILIATGYNGDNVVWYKNDGRNNFTLHMVTTDAQDMSAVYACDIDGDGDMDVLSASKFTSNLYWNENDGSENFTTHTISTQASDAAFVYACDFDGDGDIDVVSSSGYRIDWYENNGSEDFTVHSLERGPSDVTSGYVCDIDGDGDMDVVASFSNYLLNFGFESEIRWYENDGNENFTTHTIIGDIDVRSVYANDVDGDGDMDVLASSYDSEAQWYSNDRVSWYENDGNSNFSAHTISIKGRDASFVYPSDIDGDGDIDVLSFWSNQLVWYENEMPTTVITYEDRDSIKSDTTEYSFVTDNNPTGTMDTIVTTTVVDSIVDSTFHITDTYTNGALTESAVDSVTVTKREEQTDQSSVTKPYQPKSTTVRDSVKSDSTEYSFVTDNSPTGIMDTIITTTVVDSIVDSIWQITDTLQDGTLLNSSAPVFKRDSTWVDTISTSTETKEYEVPVAIEQIEADQKTGSIIFAPNPVSLAHGEVYFVIPEHLRGEMTVTIFDYLGNVIDSQEFENAGGNTYRWDLRNDAGVQVASGTYVAVIEVEFKDGSRNIVKRSIGVRQ